jgi:YD repeat-containing protein
VLLSFGYDSAGRVVTITDADSNVTTVQRNAQGQPTAIIGPFGQQTTLALDGAGYLASVLDPAGNRVRLFHQASGLLDSLTDARGGVHRFTYDSLGRLRRDDAPAGFYQMLALTETDTSGTVSVATTMGRTTTYGVWGLSTGSTRRVVTDPAGFATTSVIDLAGRTTIALPTGDSVRTVSRPDPRWTMQAPNLDSIKVRVPSGATVTVNARRKVTLADPNDPLSITAQYDTSCGRAAVRADDIGRHHMARLRLTQSTARSFARLDSLGRPIMARVPDSTR